MVFLLVNIFNIKGKGIIFTTIFLSILIPTILDILNAIIFRKDGTKSQKKFDNKIGIIWSSILRGIISIMVLPFKAYMSLNAIIKTIYRTKISKKKLLEWTTAEEAEKTSKTDLRSYIKYMIIEVIFGIIILLLCYKRPFLIILALLWIISPYIMWYISKENKNQLENISDNDKDYILELGKNTWNYFNTYINKENNFLPPDNYQEDRSIKTVNRTSSTNIGLGLLSIVSAYDLKYIEQDYAINLIEKMIKTIEKLPKWNGHLYNWYNITNLMPLIPRYISTVDSGNFVGYLYTLVGFLEEIKKQNENREKINNLIEKINKIIKDTDFSVLYDKEKSIFSIGYNLEEEKLTNSYYDLLASEARQASLIAIAKRDIPAKHWNNLSRTLTVLDKYKGLVSWSGTAFEYLMPNINIPRYPGSLLDESCKFMIYSQQKYCKKLGIPWGISESAFNLKDLNSNYQYKAFGIPWLGLKRGLADEMVVSSYGSILAIIDKPNDVIENLKILEKEGMRGKFGLYEAIDYTPTRVKYDKKAVPVKTYMAHHQALILLSINNYINNNILQKRFMNNPEIKTIDILLQENMPENVIITKERKEKIDKIKYLGYNTYSERVYTKINENLNDYNVIANGEYSVIIDKKGNGFSKYNNIQINRFKETENYEQGIYFYVKNVRTKKVWKSVYSNDADEYRAHFTPDIDKFVRRDENIETITKIIVAPNENVEIRRIELTNKGNIEEIMEVTSILEPIISKKEQDYAHPAFNNLFLKYSVLENNSIFIKRNKRGNVEPIYLAVNLFTNSDTIGDLEYEIDKSKLYESEKIDIPEAVKASKPFSSSTGLVVEPIVALKRTIKVLPGETVTLNLIISVSDNEEIAKNNLQMYENNENIERCFELSKARIEEESRYLGITGGDIENFQKVFSYLQFQNPTKKLYINKLPKISYKQSELWKYGISGDLPILLVKIKYINDINLIKEVLKAYEFLRVKNVNIDLVILDEEENVYERYVQDAINNEILSMQLSYMQNISGGIFILNSNEIEDVNLLLFRANLCLEANKGNLKTILNDIEDEYLDTIKNIGNDNIKYEIPSKNDNNLKIELENLKYYNEYGAFSEDGKEYIIKVNKNITPPAVWSHIIANEKFGTLITNNMGGFTWSQNSRLNRLTVWSNNTLFDTPSEIIYLKDIENGEICSLGSKPIKTNNDYYIIYGFGYAKYIHSDLGIIQEDEIFVPRVESAKINIIKLKNTMPNKKKLKLYYYIRPVLGEDEIKTNGYIDLQFNKNSNIIYANNLYGEEYSKIFYISSSEKILSYTGSKKEFIGKGTMSNPDGIKKVRLAEENSLGIDSCIVIQIDVELESYETKEISLIIGEEDNILDAQNMAYKYCKLSNCLEELNNVKKFWIDNLSKLQVSTPVESTNIILNGWLVYQTIVSRLWSRTAFYQSGGAIGFRDQLQDTLGLKYIFPEMMKNQIIKHSKRQFIEGDVEHWWHEETSRGIRTKFSDDLLWMVFVIEEYIELTNNFDILDYITPYLMGAELNVDEDEKYDLYNEAGIAEDIYHHCIKAIEKSVNNFGENNLPKIGTGDWNDGLSTVGNKGKGESVWLGFFLYIVLDRFIPICEKKNDIELKNKYTKIKDELKKSLNTVAWDGRWYKRAFTDDGDVLGSIVNEECKIDNISQAWSVISNAGDNDKKYISMESLENHLIDRENGIIKLLDPPFEKSKLEPGYIKAYLPGVRENGGQYTHAAVWTIIAECILGFGDKAYEYFKMINPIEHSRTVEQANKYKVEPYVIAADIYGAENLKGRGGWTWYTGSSSWYYKAGIEYILGLRIENKILKIKPCIPKEWKEYNIQYKYGSSTYNIKIKNPNSKNTGIERFIVNGEEIQEKEILLQDNSKIYNIEIYM